MINSLWIVSPFEAPNINLAVAAADSGAFPVLHLGYDLSKAEAALSELSQRIDGEFGVCIAAEEISEISLPRKVRRIILPWGFRAPKSHGAEIIWQIHSVEEAYAAFEKKVKSIVLKGGEGAGLCGEDSSFILFQRLIDLCHKSETDAYIQGGVGVHTAAAWLSLGAKGVLMDSQLALLSECGTSSDTKSWLRKLSGSDIKQCEHYRYHVRPGAHDPASGGGLADVLHEVKSGGDCLPLGQDAVLAVDYADQYKRLKYLVQAVEKAIYSHLSIVKNQDGLAPNGEMAKFLGTEYPIAQGPMARVSDVPEFLKDVADAGALPYLAMSMMTGDDARETLEKTAAAMGDKPWGVGILGFIYPKVLEEQTRLIIEAKPNAVLIAGGRPDQAKIFEQAGISVFLHIPAPSLLEMYLKEGARSFIFEGRESGGHVGPLYSSVLWEKQMSILLAQDNLPAMKVFFAGGIHDALSAAFVRIVAAPLTARDVKVGIQVGTVYLYSNEIVKRGAITADYRKQLIENETTLLLKSGNGQETRSVPSPYTDFFLSEKARMKEAGMQTSEILAKLEDLNLGRTRIAAKGIERQGDKLVKLNKAEQLEKGLFMTGAITALIDKPTSIPAIHKALTERSNSLIAKLRLPKAQKADASVNIAVIGMAGVFPEADDLDEYWRNIVFGRDSITEVPKERWSADLFFDPDTKDTDHVVSKWGAFIGTSDFDALEFGITPQSLAAIEPVQLLSLLVTKRALEDAGFSDLAEADFSETSVIFGAQGVGELGSAYGFRQGLMQVYGELPEEAQTLLPRLTEDSFAGVLSNVIAGRISNRLNTGGRNYTVDAACASSLAALDAAWSELSSGRSDMVVLGGADLQNGINSFLMFNSTYALSRSGHCSTFDAEADGIALGEGVGALILKRLEDAERDGNRIYAVLKGIGGSSDGKSLGLTAPSRYGQRKALERAYANAGVNPADVGLIEAHGTGTVVGDRIELKALTDVFLDAGTQPRRTQLGSVKTQIGHTKCAAGVAGLIKAVLAVQHGLLPPTLHLTSPNDAYSKHSPFTFRTENTVPWQESRRIAGVSGFGFGGTNFHTIVESYSPKGPEIPLKAWPSELFVFPGDTPEEAQVLMEKTKTLYAVNNKLKLRDVAASLAVYNDKAVQYAIVAGNWKHLLTCIDDALAGQDNSNVFLREPVDGKVALLFSGQGSQRVNMAADLFVVFPKMRRLLDQHPEYADILFPPAMFTDEGRNAQRDTITDTRNAQPLLGIVDLAIAELFRDLGIEADMAAGHSYGELPALCFAGAFDANALTGLSRDRAESILAAAGDDPGRMAAVLGKPEKLETLLEGETEVWAVNYNAPRQTVVAGTSAGIEAFIAKLKAEKVACEPLNVACAFHSPILAKAKGIFAEKLKSVSFKKPRLQVWSNTTAGAYPGTATAIKSRLAEHLVNPVLFTKEIEGMYEAGARVFIEAGPGGVLTGLASKILKGKGIVAIQTESKGEEGLSHLLKGLARYITTGRKINMEKLYDERSTTQVDLDDPETNKKQGIVWNIDGRSALPEKGNLPAHAGTIQQGGLMSIEELKKYFSGADVETIMMAYLDNMNSVIQDQRDVMLGYLGQPDMIPRATAARREFVSAANEIHSLQEAEEVESTEAGSEENGLPEITSLTTEEITDIIMEIVCDKTGYPLDMLNLDMDLEADLSIDSIKKMEIIGGLREKVNFPENMEGMEEFFEKIISIRTFKDMIAWFEEIGKAAADGTLVTGSGGEFAGVQALEEAAIPAKEVDTIVRMVLSRKDLPLKNIDDKLIEGKRFAIAGDGGELTDGLLKALKDKGAEARAVTADEADIADCDGLILIDSANAEARYTTLDLVRLIKASDMDKLHWIAVFDDQHAALMAAKKPSEAGLPEGYAGLIKTLYHEYPEKRLVAVGFNTPFDKKSFPSIVLGELTAEMSFPEAFYDGDDRFCLAPQVKHLDESTKQGPAPALDETSNILVLGGAQGITPSLVSKLAATYPCHYILAGRSAVETESTAYDALESIDDIRQYLIKEEGMKEPKAIEEKARRVYKTNQVKAAIAMIEAAGGKASYHSIDVRDEKAFLAFVKKIKKSNGKIDGVIHAAGILEDKRFKEKTIESFERVYSTKATPLKVVLNALVPDLKLLAMFSSMSSSFGNIGQCDYSAGNNVLDRLTRILNAKYPEIRTIAFNWGPWKGAGMVNAGLEKEFQKRGISFLKLDIGGAFFAEELIKGEEPSVLAIAGDEKEIETYIKAALE